MPLDRSKFKAAPISAMKKLDGELGQRKGYSDYKKVGYHSIDTGDNKFRIYPPHPDSPDGVFWYPKSMAFMSLETDLYDDKGEKTGEKIIKRRPVFTSDVHGPRDLAGKDLIKMYIEYAKKRFEEIYESEEEKKTAGDLLYNWKVGIGPKLSWIMYADKYDEKGQKTLAYLELGNGTKKKMNELASDMDSGDSPIAVDPFTDPEDGIAIIINKSGEGLKTEYKLSLEQKRTGKLQVHFVPTPLTDEDLEKLMEFDPLYKPFKDSFRRRDFELQQEGLMRFDSENQFFFFEEEDWITKMEEMATLIERFIPEDKKAVDSEVEENSKPEAKREEPKMHASMKSKTIKEVPALPDPKEDDYEEEEDEAEEEEEKPEVKVEKTSDSTADRLAAIKARLAAGKK